MLSNPTGAQLSALGWILSALISTPAAWAQSAAPAPATARPAEPALEAGRGNQTIERIRTEDAGSRIDELRV